MSSTARAIVGPKLQNILFTTDFSACSDAAFVYARAIAGFYNSTVHVVHVINPEPVTGELGVLMPDTGRQHESETEEAARRMMNCYTQSDAFRGLLHTQIIEKGPVWNAVARLVESLHIDLIVVGTRGRHGMKHLMLGSVAEQIFRHATCPVLTVGPEIHKNGLAAGKLATILFATDFSPASHNALEYARFLAHARNAALVLLHVMTSNEALVLDYYKEAIGELKQQLTDLMPDDPGINYSVSVEFGPAAEQIIKKASEMSADLIVMGAHRGPSASAHAPWAVAHQVVCHAPCPVMTVRG